MEVEVKENRNRPPVMVVINFAVLPYQKRHLVELSQKTKKNLSELGREALSFLFTEYHKMGY